MNVNSWIECNMPLRVGTYDEAMSGRKFYNVLNPDDIAKAYMSEHLPQAIREGSYDNLLTHYVTATKPVEATIITNHLGNKVVAINPGNFENLTSIQRKAVLAHEAFHAKTPILGGSELLAHLYGGLKTKTPISELTRFILGNPKRFAKEIVPIILATTAFGYGTHKLLTGVNQMELDKSAAVFAKVQKIGNNLLRSTRNLGKNLDALASGKYRRKGLGRLAIWRPTKERLLKNTAKGLVLPGTVLTAATGVGYVKSKVEKKK